jgi:hypothetical protein
MILSEPRGNLSDLTAYRKNTIARAYVRAFE